MYSAPEVLETTNRYNENDGVSKRVHELAFGIVVFFLLLLFHAIVFILSLCCP